MVSWPVTSCEQIHVAAAQVELSVPYVGEPNSEARRCIAPRGSFGSPQ